MMRKAPQLLIFIFIWYASVLIAEVDTYSEYWQKLFFEMWSQGDFSIGTFIKIESCDHLKKIRSFQGSEQFAWQVSKIFQLKFHYTYIHGHPVNLSSWEWQHRLELEANRDLKLKRDCLIATRNRLEIRRIEYQPKTRFRFRQMTMLVIPLEKSFFKVFSMSNELFYDMSLKRFDQDRICPCQLSFAVNEKLDMDIFFIIRFFLHDKLQGLLIKKT
jgi:hypothetical protein